MKSSKFLFYPHPVDCGSPYNPQNGSVTSFTGTTNGSVAFYSCDPRLVPVMGMRAVCTGNGRSPNPADLSCSVGMLVMVTRSCQGAHVWYIVQWKLLQMSTGPLEELLFYTHALAMLSASFYSIAIYCMQIVRSWCMDQLLVNAITHFKVSSFHGGGRNAIMSFL